MVAERAGDEQVPWAAVEISAAQARRIALAAQGFTTKRPATPSRRHVHKIFDQIDLIQIDSVNVIARSQDLVLHARLGPHPRDLIPKLVRSGEVFEYWGHEASLLPVALQPLMRWRMDAAKQGKTWSGIARINRDKGSFVQDVLEQVVERGPITAGELSEPSRKSGPWWGWGDGKLALEYLFWTGQITARRRANNFEREYASLETFLPAAILAMPTPSEHDARCALLLRAARSLGVATATDLADYHRQKPTVVKPLLDMLVNEGLLQAVRVAGWKHPAYLHPEAEMPRRVRCRALLSPFDSLVWNRDRAERLFDFHYRIEIYTPAPKRVYGYYVLPFLLGDQLVGRVDLKADRANGELLVRGAYYEPGYEDPETAEGLAEELRSVATWLGLDRIVVSDKGDLSADLTSTLEP